jgi:uncharacterized protein (TIGR00661 family)
MKILYAIQGTGNGHLSRAMEIVPAIERRAEVDILVSGMHVELDLGRPIKYRLKGLGFKFGKRGGVDYFNTWWEGDTTGFLQEIRDLDLSGYDLVINDFEPVSAWAARRQHVPCVGLSNQCVLLDQRIPKPPKSAFDTVGRTILKHYAPVDMAYGFHYQSLEPFITTPVVRTEVRALQTSRAGYYMVYLPAYNDRKILKALRSFPNTEWVVFSKHSKKAYSQDEIQVHPIDNQVFLEKLAGASGVICAAGFSTTSEVLFLGKKLLVIPMKKQFEQQCNALALENFGVPVVKSLKKKWRKKISAWLQTDAVVKVHYPDNAQVLVDRIIIDYAQQSSILQDVFEIHKSAKADI